MSIPPREVISACPLAGILLAPTGRKLHGNEAWSSLATDVGDDWLEAVHPDDRTIAETMMRVRATGREIRIVSKTAWKWVLVSSHPSEEGTTLWFQELERERQDVLQSLERERELNSLKNRFISLVSHEFRTPLTVILSSAELLEHYGGKWPEERRVQHLRKIHTAVTVMTSLLDNVGLYGRAESGSLENRVESFDASAMVAEMVGDLQMTLPVEQTLSFEDHAQERLVHADPRLLKHILANLLGNAVRFSPHATPVEVLSKWEYDSWILEIRDRGIGIPPQDDGRIWERFQRGSNVGSIPGTGLGLAIVRRCAEIMHAKVELSARDGCGTVSRVELPNAGANAVEGKKGTQ